MNRSIDEYIKSYYEARATSLHVPEEVMLSFVAGDMAPETSAIISAHLVQCNRCRELRTDAEVYSHGLSQAPIEVASNVREIAGRAQEAVLRTLIEEDSGDSPIIRLGETVLFCAKQLETGIKRVFAVDSLSVAGRYVIEYMGRVLFLEVSDQDLNPSLAHLTARGSFRGPKGTRIALVRKAESKDGHLLAQLRAVLPEEGDKPTVSLSIEYFED